VDVRFTYDYMTLAIYFLGGYKLGKDEEVKVILSGKDLAGNELKTNLYSFKTISSTPSEPAEDFTKVFI